MWIKIIILAMVNDIELLQLLEPLGGLYAFYYRAEDQKPILLANCEKFPSASLIKVPVLLAWLALERTGEVDRNELCNLDSLPQVEGAGLSYLLRTRHLPYQDVLLLMIALSDNLCANLVIEKIGQERLNDVFCNVLGLTATELQRKMMDFEARSRGRENWIGVQDCIRLYELIQELPPGQKTWADTVLSACDDGSLLLRDLQRDTKKFYHKTGSISSIYLGISPEPVSILHDWGYTDDCQIFLLTGGIKDEAAACQVFGQLGRFLSS